jgi:hypothetical protein
LLARGFSTTGIRVEEKLLQVSDNEYSLHVDIIPNATTVAIGWFIQIKVPKLPHTAIVKLNVKRYYY